jgi:hypothetical protein
MQMKSAVTGGGRNMNRWRVVNIMNCVILLYVRALEGVFQI